MTLLQVPDDGAALWPTLGPGVVAWMHDSLVYGPGDLRGQPYRLDDEKIGLIWRLYEVYPRGHANAGRRRFRRAALSMRKGSAKTEFGAAISAVELAEDGPVRCDGWRKEGRTWVPVGAPVTDPYIPMLAYTEEQSEELAYSALYVMLSEGPRADRFDFGLQRIMRVNGDGKAAALATAPDSRDGARTTFELFDEPLALDTPVPTPTGWTTMGAIEVGDKVIGRDGTCARVIGTSPVAKGRPCYRVLFVDGTSVVTDKAHRWAVIDRKNPTHGVVTRTTLQMSQDVRLRSYGGREPIYRWATPQSEPLRLSAIRLPIDPYVLGAWLGDGDSRAATVTQSENDTPELVAALAGRGTRARRISSQGAPRLYLDGLRKGLRLEGLLGEKRIPERYLRASIDQRLELLRGLMDTDGHVTSRGWCTFSTNRTALASQMAELLRTLGHRPTIIATEDARSRTGVGIKVSFQSRPGMVPFSLARKALRCSASRAARQVTRSIVSIEPVPSVPVRCIGVDNADHLFLVGEGMVPTHNTHRLVLPRQREAHRTMLANLPKRRIADPWALEVTTAPAPGEGSVAEGTMDYAREVQSGRIPDARLFFFHRQASESHDLATREGIRAAVLEASGPVAPWSDIDGIVEQWDDPTADRTYLARVWLNQVIRGSDRAFDHERWKALASSRRMPAAGTPVTIGFDGSRTNDATALVATEVESGFQWLLGLWQRPATAPEDWEVPAEEVDETVTAAFERFRVRRMYADPTYWTSEVRAWVGRYGKDVVAEWPTYRNAQMARAAAAYADAIALGLLSHDGDPRFAEHIGNTQKRYLPQVDEDGKRLWVMQKERPDSPHKIDAAMAGCLSWEARTHALTTVARRLRAFAA